MSIRLRILSAAVAGAAAIALPAASRAQDVCSTSAQQRQCSLECCGRLDCTPSCQAFCVRACIDACRTPAKQSSYQGQLAEMKRRCGYVIAPSRVAPK
jgi:hypothetical protein